jgi:RNA polymerase sigma-70 factor (ECF subfamily)
MVGNAAEAEALTQAAFLKFFRQIATQHADAARAIVLYRLVTNEVLMRLRDYTPHYDSMPCPGSRSDDYNCNPHSASGFALPVTSSFIDRSHLAQAVLELPPSLRVVFVLHDILGHRDSDVGAVVGISAETSKAHLHKARLRLHELLRTHSSERFSAVS